MLLTLIAAALFGAALGLGLRSRVLALIVAMVGGAPFVIAVPVTAIQPKLSQKARRAQRPTVAFQGWITATSAMMTDSR